MHILLCGVAVHKYIRVEARRQSWRSFLRCSPTFSPETGPLSGMELSVKARLMANDPQGPACPFFGAGTTGMCYNAQLFYVASGDQTQDLYLQSKHFTSRDVSSATVFF